MAASFPVAALLLSSTWAMGCTLLGSRGPVEGNGVDDDEEEKEDDARRAERAQQEEVEGIGKEEERRRSKARPAAAAAAGNIARARCCETLLLLLPVLVLATAAAEAREVWRRGMVASSFSLSREGVVGSRSRSKEKKRE